MKCFEIYVFTKLFSYAIFKNNSFMAFVIFINVCINNSYNFLATCCRYVYKNTFFEIIILINILGATYEIYMQYLWLGIWWSTRLSRAFVIFINVCINNSYNFLATCCRIHHIIFNFRITNSFINSATCKFTTPATNIANSNNKDKWKF
mgnify:CR=1 FL=1